MRLANHLTFIKLSKLTIRRRTWNNSLGCIIFFFFSKILLFDSANQGACKNESSKYSSVIGRAPVIATVITKATEELKPSQLAPNNIVE